MNYTFDESNIHDYNITFPILPEFIEKNGTMYLHIEIEADYAFKNEDLDPRAPDHKLPSYLSDAVFEEDGQKIIMHRSIPLIKHDLKSTKKKTVNLLGETVEESSEPVKETIKTQDEGVEETDDDSEVYVQYLKPDLYLYMAPETQIYKRDNIPEQFKNLIKINKAMGFYEPIFELTDFWVYKDILVELNETVSQANVTVHIQPYSFWRIAMFGQYEQTNKVYKDMGIDNNRDMMIKMLVETNFYLLVLTMFVSIAHTVCEFMAFKNEIHFWKNRDTLRGISVRTLFINLAMSVIIFLYLLDSEETSYMISIPAGIGIAIECWKITKAMKVSSKPTFPYISIEDKESYHENDTNKYDKIAMTYLSYLMYPLLAIYTVYSLVYEEHKGWYSFVINTLVGAVYVFGFITMTPQLYINYKLKSVEHLPWRALIYRFLNTIIDDLFSFIISMPNMHRVACFRDDVIFLIYLYQRWIYRVDKTRDPYGDFGDDQDEHKQEREQLQSDVVHDQQDGQADQVKEEPSQEVKPEDEQDKNSDKDHDQDQDQEQEDDDLKDKEYEIVKENEDEIRKRNK